MPTPTATSTIDRLDPMIRRAAAAASGRIKYLKLRCDPRCVDEVKQQLPAHLADMGLDFVDVDLEAHDGEPEIVEVRRDAGWA